MQTFHPLLDTVHPTVISADGTRIWTTTAGRHPNEAPVLVLIPGLSCPSLWFTKQFQDPALLSKFCLVTYEPRGQGRSGQPTEKEAYSSRKFAEDFKAVCDAFGAKKVFIVAWSYAGLIITDVFAHLGPEWVAGVILIGAFPWRKMHPETANPTVWIAFGPLLTDDLLAVTGGFEVFFNSCVYTPNVVAMPYSMRMALLGVVAAQHHNARQRLVDAREQDPTKLLEHADTLEVMEIIGEHDCHVDPIKIKAFMEQRFAKFQFRLIEDCGHAPFYERTEDVNQMITEFVEKVTGK